MSDSESYYSSEAEEDSVVSGSSEESDRKGRRRDDAYDDEDVSSRGSAASGDYDEEASRGEEYSESGSRGSRGEEGSYQSQGSGSRYSDEGSRRSDDEGSRRSYDSRGSGAGSAHSYRTGDSQGSGSQQEDGSYHSKSSRGSSHQGASSGPGVSDSEEERSRAESYHSRGSQGSYQSQESGGSRHSDERSRHSDEGSQRSYESQRSGEGSARSYRSGASQRSGESQGSGSQRDDGSYHSKSSRGSSHQGASSGPEVSESEEEKSRGSSHHGASSGPEVSDSEEERSRADDGSEAGGSISGEEKDSVADDESRSIESESSGSRAGNEVHADEISAGQKDAADELSQASEGDGSVGDEEAGDASVGNKSRGSSVGDVSVGSKSSAASKSSVGSKSSAASKSSVGSKSSAASKSRGSEGGDADSVVSGSEKDEESRKSDGVSQISSAGGEISDSSGHESESTSAKKTSEMDEKIEKEVSEDNEGSLPEKESVEVQEQASEQDTVSTEKDSSPPIQTSDSVDPATEVKEETQEVPTTSDFEKIPDESKSEKEVVSAATLEGGDEGRNESSEKVPEIQDSEKATEATILDSTAESHRSDEKLDSKDKDDSSKASKKGSENDQEEKSIPAGKSSQADSVISETKASADNTATKDSSAVKKSSKDVESAEDEGSSEDDSAKEKTSRASQKSTKSDTSSSQGKKKSSESTGNNVRRRTGNVLDFYHVQDLIGKGAFASVYAAKNKETGAIRAAKEMKKCKENELNNKQVLNEVELLTGLDHPTLVRPYEVCVILLFLLAFVVGEDLICAFPKSSQLFENDQYYFLVTDICNGGTLRDALMKSGLYSETRAATLMKQLLSCVDYFHGKGIIHRDLKPGNILLEEKKSDKIRVIDFGLATRIKEGEKLSEPMGTPAYMAPEVLGMSYGKESDLWSCGIILFLILSGQQPFKGKTTEETFTHIVTGEYSFSNPVWENISYDAKDLIKKLLNWDVNARLTAAQALKHPWVTSKGKSGSSMEKSVPVVTEDTEETKPVEPPKVSKKEVDAGKVLNFASSTYIALKLLPKKEKKKIEKIYRAIDTSENGELSKAEARIGYEAVLERSLNDEEMDLIFKHIVDPGGKGTLHSSGFLLGAILAKNMLTRENLLKIFPIFEKSEDGQVSMQELRDMLKEDLALEEKIVEKIANDMQKEGNIRVSFDEFLRSAAVPVSVKMPEPEVKPPSEPEPIEVEIEKGSAKPVEEVKVAEKMETDSKASKTKSLKSFMESNQTDSDSDGLEDDAKSCGDFSIKLSATQFVSHRLGQLTDHYEIVDYIAKGTYGVVCSALHKETGTVRAIKELKKSKKNKAKNDLLLREFHILKSLDHPNIIQMHDKKHYYIVTGVSSGGDLYHEIKRRGSFEEQDAAILMRQILICVNYCHKHNVVHRDLKPGNVLLEGHKNLNHLKIIDFGEAIIAPPEQKLTDIAGTMAYMAPEVLGMNYGHKCDVWSCGVIAFFVLAGRPPFKGENDQETFNNIVKGNISYHDAVWEKLSDNCKQFVQLLLSWEQDLRPTAEEALQHPWITQNYRRKSKIEELRENAVGALSNLEAFDAQSKLRVATCTFIATQLMDKEEREKIDDVFRAIDLNNDGTLNREEVKLGYEQFFNRALSDQEIDAIFQHVDADGTGELEYSEFLFGALDKKNLLSPANLKKAFSIFADASGDITFDKLKTLLKDSLTQDEEVDDKALNKLIKQIDLDGDGKISYEEFVSMALGPSPEKPAESVEEASARDDASDGGGDDDDEDASSAPAPAPDDKKVDRESPIRHDDSSRHLQQAIARASQQQNQSRSNRDPPDYKLDRADPPSEEERMQALLEKKRSKASDPEPLSGKPAEKAATSEVAPEAIPVEEVIVPVTTQIEIKEPSRRRISSRERKIEEAFEGFDRVQEKIARLRILLSAKDTDTKRSQPRRAEDRRPPPSIETLDSAVKKLSEIQSKMRALQALVKSNRA